ncbi:MAG: NfeD family protein [Pseudomonadota bacterium]
MVWWGWMVIGLLLMCAEMMAVDAAFYLVFLGFAAVIVGFVGMLGIDLPIAGQWILFAGLAATSMVFFRRKVYLKIRGNPIGFSDQVDGRHVTVMEDVAAGGQTRVEFRGSRWDATNVGTAALATGDQAIINKTDGSRLEITALNPPG